MADDNNELLNSLIGMLGDNPEEKINAVLSSLTGKGSSSGTSGEATEPSVSAFSSETDSGPDLSVLMKIQSLLSQTGGTSDDRSRLLLALKPFLSSERKPHVDRALQLLKLTKLAEAAKEMDILKDFKL